MKRIATILGIILVGIGLYFAFKFSGAVRAVVAQPNAHVSSKAVRPVPALPKRASIAQASAPAPLTLEDIVKRHGLDATQRWELNSALGRVWRSWLELKGEHAEVLAYDGKTMRMRIPALRLDDDGVAAAMLEHLAIGIGKEEAQALWADPITRGALISQAGQRIFTEAAYTFTKVKAEDPQMKYPPSFATFVVEVRAGARNESEGGENSSPELLTIEGFTYLEAENGWAAIGWNAMAKVPAGYFRSEPILGIVSRPRNNSVVIQEDLDTGETVVRNQRFEGSKDLMQADGTFRPLN